MLLLVGFIALAAGVVVVVLGGITSQSGDVGSHLADAKNTIAGGSLFGAAGLILAAPVTSAVVRISADLAQARGSPIGAEGESAPKACAVPA